MNAHLLDHFDSRTRQALDRRDSLAGILSIWRQRAVSRRRLAELDLRLLEDIGVDPLDAAREAARPFWRA